MFSIPSKQFLLQMALLRCRAGLLALAVGAVLVWGQGCGQIDRAQALISAGNIADARVILEGRAAHGDGRAQRMLMNLIASKRIEESDPTRKDQLLDASLRQGVLLREGKVFLVETEQNRMILKTYAKAIANDPSARLALGYFFFIGEGVFADPKRSTFWTELAAESGDPQVLLEVGSRFFDGQTVPKDVAKARHYWQLAAKKGSVEAQRRLEGIHPG